MIKGQINMQRDMDLIRLMLLTIEAEDHGFAPHPIKIPNYTKEQIGYHAVLLGEAGLADVRDVTSMGSGSPEAMIIRLTWAGHEFLDSARQNKVWNLTKDAIGEIGGASLDIWIALLSANIKRMLGI
jgi:hypothetical protein